MNDSSQQALLKEIDQKVGEVRTDAIDLSFGEIINLKSTNEIRIDPEYQRLFRWSLVQRSRLIESVLLRLPVPPIFLIENEDGTLELIDGLQRVSTMIQLIDPKLIEADDLILSGCDLIESLNGKTFSDFPLTLKLQLKRSTVRAVTIKRQSKSFLRYEMFKRLNTGGSELSPQEVRNCSSRLFGEWGVSVYEFIRALSKSTGFVATTETISESEAEKRGLEELVLRFFAAKDGAGLYAGHVANWLDEYLEKILVGGPVSFNFAAEQLVFEQTFNRISAVLGEGAFCKYKDDQPIGGLAPAHFEAIAIAFANRIVEAEAADTELLREKITAARQSADFRANVGPGANNRGKLLGRIAVIEKSIQIAAV
jgi:hypothetical protein